MPGASRIAAPSLMPRSPLHTAAASLRRAKQVRDPRGIVSRHAGLVYFPVPKAATTTIKAMIASWEGLPTGDGIHRVRFDAVRASRVRDVPDALAFTVVRNPWDRLRSAYLDKVVGNATRWGEVHDGLLRYNTLSRRKLFWGEMTFEQFVRTVTRIPDSLADEHLRAQVRLLAPWGKPPVVDRWIDLARMSEELPALLASRGIEVGDLVRRNERSSGDYREAYSAEMREQTGHRYRRDVDYFGFAF